MCTSAPIYLCMCDACHVLYNVCISSASVQSLCLALVCVCVEMTLSGSGLNNTKDPTAAVCRFTRNDQPMNEFTTKATPEGYHRLTCPLPPFNATSDFEG